MATDRLMLGPVDSAGALVSAVEQVSALHPQCMMLFRGQNNLHPSLRSGLARPEVRYEPDVEQGWSAVAGQILGHESVTARNIHFRMAVLQHYGLKTYYVDATSDARVAAWFASNKFEPHTVFYGGSPIRKLNQVRYAQRRDGTGFVLVLTLPNADELKTARRLFDISTVDPFLRPNRQKAWLLYDRKPLIPDPNDFWVATISVDCSKFASDLVSDYLFPLPTEDPGFHALLNLPFVELPGVWLEEAGARRETQANAPNFDFGMRALDVPEYVHSGSKEGYNHKWNDKTLTEAKPMQMWVKWKFDLSDVFPEIRGNIQKATKITLSPQAHEVLHGAPEEMQLRWPSLGTDELFFTFAQFGYDRVIDIEYPYHGVWLHRDKDLVVEHPMSADENSLNVHPGHIYEFIGQELLRQELPTSCACKSPRSHDIRVRARLRLSTLIEMEHLILIPHPLKIPNWYFVL